MRVACGWVASHGRGRGAFRCIGARRGIRLVPLHAIPRRGAGSDLSPRSRGNCVALMPAGISILNFILFYFGIDNNVDFVYNEKQKGAITWIASARE